MSNIKKLMASAAGGAALNVEDVFSIDLYVGNTPSSQTITNNIDISGSGGLVMGANRDSGNGFFWYDTKRGVSSYLQPRLRVPDATNPTGYDVTSFNSDGFTIGQEYTGGFNGSGDDLATWTYRVAPKFFDMVTYTGDGTSGRSISHSLGSAPGMIIIKNLTRDSDWFCWHRSLSGYNYGIIFNYNQYGQFTNAGILTADPTSTTVSIKNPGYDGNGTNGNGDEYIMYLFAHNNGDGEFGPTEDQDIIKCGSYTGNGSNDGPTINLGFEPQWIMITRKDGSGDWIVLDTMRGITSRPYSHSTGNTRPGVWYLLSSASQAEFLNHYLDVNSTGFQLGDTAGSINGNGGEYIYIAVRRGPMAIPESATDVFGMDTYGGTLPNPPAFDLGDTVDFGFWKQLASSSSWATASRSMQSNIIYTNTDSAEGNDTSSFFDFQEGWYDASGTSTSVGSWMWKRAPNFFDVVTYQGNGSSGHAITHNLGVTPEMIWVKRRNNSGPWMSYHKDVNGGTNPEQYYFTIDGTADASQSSAIWNDTAPTSTTFTLGNNNFVNNSSSQYLAVLFASLDGISKLGSYTGNGNANGNSQTITGLGFQPRFIMIRRTDNSGYASVWDSTRTGWSSGNDNLLSLNNTGVFTGTNYLDATSDGFTVYWRWSNTDAVNYNGNGGNYIYYAIA